MPEIKKQINPEVGTNDEGKNFDYIRYFQSV